MAIEAPSVYMYTPRRAGVGERATRQRITRCQFCGMSMLWLSPLACKPTDDATAQRLLAVVWAAAAQRKCARVVCALPAARRGTSPSWTRFFSRVESAAAAKKLTPALPSLYFDARPPGIGCMTEDPDSSKPASESVAKTVSSAAASEAEQQTAKKRKHESDSKKPAKDGARDVSETEQQTTKKRKRESVSKRPAKEDGRSVSHLKDAETEQQTAKKREPDSKKPAKEDSKNVSDTTNASEREAPPAKRPRTSDAEAGSNVSKTDSKKTRKEVSKLAVAENAEAMCVASERQKVAVASSPSPPRAVDGRSVVRKTLGARPLSAGCTGRRLGFVSPARRSAETPQLRTPQSSSPGSKNRGLCEPIRLLQTSFPCPRPRVGLSKPPPRF
eukprot:TRINITY_DN5530_c0_g1_i1.p1 TRINITY_DN5530_c0_g1~~TRINITY_DN5530_c0_g1_i1.p1  ORF type:complete len:387 (+),score=36.03 TRINITY_DN5530_c0_g1_i1:497-1657(+)